MDYSVVQNHTLYRSVCLAQCRYSTSAKKKTGPKQKLDLFNKRRHIETKSYLKSCHVIANNWDRRKIVVLGSNKCSSIEPVSHGIHR